MSTFADLQAKVDALAAKSTDLTTAAGTASAALQSEIARVEQVIADLRTQAGQVPTQTQIDALASSLDQTMSNLTTIQQGLDAATIAANAVEPASPPTP